MSLRCKYILTVALLIGLMIAAVTGGDHNEFLLLLQGKATDEFCYIVTAIRLPRIIGAAVTGVLLASAGCTVQLLFRNPLSSPHVLGAVNASALGAVGVMALGIHSLWGLFAGSCFGALVSLLLLLMLPRSRGSIAVLLLAGIALNAFASAAMSGILFIAGEHLEGLIFWLLGGFWKMEWSSCWLLIISSCIVLLLLSGIRREMNMLYLGETAAAHAGVNTARVIVIAVLCAAVSVAAAVGCSGVIGFVGLLVPHIGRRVFGSEFFCHLAGSALIGAGLMIASDWAARTLAAPMEIPVGVLTSLIGAPFFMILILRCCRKGAVEL